MRSPIQEQEIAKRLGGKVTPGSGAGMEKGDVRVKGKLRVECKTTTKKSFSVTVKMLEKIELEAVSCGEDPALVVEFLDEGGKVLQQVAIVPMRVLEELSQ